MFTHGKFVINMISLFFIMKKDITQCRWYARFFLACINISLFAFVVLPISANNFDIQALQQQNYKDVSGFIYDEQGSAVIGATIQVQGTNLHTISDQNGFFSLKVPKVANRVAVSYIGYKDKIAYIGKDNKLKITLYPSSSSLNEIVVVGYGTQKKANLTGAVQSISGEDITRRSVATVSQALQGIVPGLVAVQSSGQPGADNASITIRGIGSLNSSSSPLVLIDGVEGDMNRLDLNTVESISVLKDAASASIYGSRASNGVILITTKRGATGDFKISYDGYIGMNSPTCLPQTVSAIEYMNAINIARSNANQEALYSPDMIDIYKTGKVDNNEYYDVNWKDEILKKTALLQNHSISVSGGSDKIHLFANAGYYSQDGQIKNNNYSRTTLRVNSDIKLKKWMKIGIDIHLRQSKAERPVMGTPNEIIGYALTMTPLMSCKNNDGTYGYGYNGVNPLAFIEVGGTRHDVAPEVGLKSFIELTPMNGLDILGSYSYKNLEENVDAFTYPYDTYEGGVYKMTYPSWGSSKAEQRGRTINKQFNFQASYERNIARHYFKLLAGIQSEEMNYKFINAGRKNYHYPEYTELNDGDASTMTNSSSRYDWALLSYLYRLNYSFANRYLLEVNGRFDGSSRFAKGHRWGFFPSVSAGWRISEENFFEPLRNVVNNLKLRASYGKLGNQSISGYYPYAASISSGANYWFDKHLTNGVAQTQLANDKISWEKSKQVDAGLDIGILNSRLTIGFDYYVRNITNMLQQFTVPLFVGMTSPWQNAGSMRNKGWDFNIGWKDHIGKMNYYITANLSDVKNKVVNLYGKNYIGYSTITEEGAPIGSYYGYVSDGYFNSQEEIDKAPCVYGGNKKNIKPGYIRYKDLVNDDPENPKIDSKDRTIIGNPFPRYNYSFTIGGNWNGFDFSLFFQGVGKKDIFYSGAGARPLISYCTLYKNQLDYWTSENKNAAYPLLLIDATGSNQNNIVSDFWIKSGAYLRLKNVVIGYTLPKQITNKISLNKVRFYISTQNLFTISHCLKGYDPENAISSSQYYPIMRTFNFGLNIDF
jgi:TonB-linked SusC/RagA family outer membrane protein